MRVDELLFCFELIVATPTLSSCFELFFASDSLSDSDPGILGGISAQEVQY